MVPLDFVEGIFNYTGFSVSGYTAVYNYPSFAIDPVLGVVTLAGIYRVMLVLWLTVKMQVRTRPPLLGRFMGALWAFVVTAMFDVFLEPIVRGLFAATGVVPSWIGSWAPQAPAHMIMVDLVGAVLGLLFCIMADTKPCMQIELREDDPDLVQLRGTTRARFWWTWRVFDVLWCWVLVPGVTALGWWFIFWGMSKTGTKVRLPVFRLDLLLSALAVVLFSFGVDALTGFLLAGYASYVDYPFRKDAGVTVSTRAEWRKMAQKTAEHQLVTAAIYAGSAGMMAVFCFGKMLPSPVGYFYQPALGSPLGLVIPAIVLMYRHFSDREMAASSKGAGYVDIGEQVSRKTKVINLDGTVGRVRK